MSETECPCYVWLGKKVHCILPCGHDDPHRLPDEEWKEDNSELMGEIDFNGDMVEGPVSRDRARHARAGTKTYGEDSNVVTRTEGTIKDGEQS